LGGREGKMGHGVSRATNSKEKLPDGRRKKHWFRVQKKKDVSKDGKNNPRVGRPLDGRSFPTEKHAGEKKTKPPRKRKKRKE